MDILELPRPVINFLRTMAKESCRYVLSWDIFGGTDTVTLTLTWKLADDEPFKCAQQASEQISVRESDSVASPRRSRRDANSSTSTSLRGSRGKSLEGNNLSPNKQMASACSAKQAASLERSAVVNQARQDSDPIYTNLCHVRCTTNPSSPKATAKSSSTTPVHSLSRRIEQECGSPLLRQVKPSLSTGDGQASKSTLTNSADSPTHDENDAVDPWVKRFERILDNEPYHTGDAGKNESDERVGTPGKVKFKKTPDYF